MKYLILIILQCNAILLLAQNKSIHFKDGVSDKEVASSLPKRAVTESSSYIELDYSFDNAEITTIKQDTSVFQLLNIQGMGKIDNVGKPALPCYNDILAVPSKNGLGIKIVEAIYQDYKGFNIAPAIEPQIDSTSRLPIKYTLDKNIYDANSFYPSAVAEIISVQDFREAPIAFIQIRPVQYNPKTKTVRCYSRIKYQVIFSSSLKSQVSSITNDRNFDILRNVISNTTISMESSSNSTLKSANAAMTTNRNYIIITTNTFLNAAKEFADWKTRLGSSCEIVSQSSWTSAQVKAAINQRYTNWTPKPEYFVIIGDHENVPGEVYFEPSYDYVTDLYYACMGGSSDHTADMARGRISVSSLDQAFTAIRKIINYERTPSTISSFYSNGLNCCHFQDDQVPPDGIEDRAFTYSSEIVRNYMVSKNYTINRVYWAGGPVNPSFYNSWYGNGQAVPNELRKPNYPWTGSNSEITSGINAGKFYVLYRGHGYGDRWSRPLYRLTDIDNLNNGNKLPIVFSIACHTGDFRQTECFAEKLLRRSNGGAVGVFAASQASWSG